MAYDFDKIARTYDRLNRVMTLGLDRRWRKRAACAVKSEEIKVKSVLDVACGTGDMCVELLKRGYTVTGVDLSEEMLAIAKRKFTHSSPLATLGSPSPNYGEESDSSSSPSKIEGVPEGRGRMTFFRGDTESLPFAEGEFDAVTCAFGVRNFVHLEQGLGEMLRVLKPGGRMVILELATPDSALIKPFYNLYTKHIIPWLGSRIAGNREAYTYLPESVERFPKGDAFLRLFPNSCERKLTFGVCRLYIINKEVAG